VKIKMRGENSIKLRHLVEGRREEMPRGTFTMPHLPHEVNPEEPFGGA
jgi:hypothetical protein